MQQIEKYIQYNYNFQKKECEFLQDKQLIYYTILHLFVECIDQTKATYSLLFTCTECGLSWNIYQSKNHALDSRFVKNIRKNHEIMQVRSIGKNIIHAKFTPEPLPVEYVRKTTKLKTVQNIISTPS